MSMPPVVKWRYDWRPSAGSPEASPELAEYKLFRPEDLRCWRAGTGYALADWLTRRGIAPKWMDPS
jgi:NAD+ diphosphatase